MSWDSLPIEVQVQILEALLLGKNSAQYASVCRAWQTIIEPRSFARLRVTQSRLAKFSDIGYRHRHLVKYIGFSIKSYDPVLCKRCWKIHRLPYESFINTASIDTIRNAIQDLVTQMSIWEPSGSLLLDISLREPSSRWDSSTKIPCRPGCLSIPKEGETKKDDILRRTPDPRFKIGNYIVKRRPKPTEEMPRVRAVTSLFLHERWRGIWTLQVLKELLDFLPEIQEVYHELMTDWFRACRLEEWVTKSIVTHPLYAPRSDHLRRTVLLDKGLHSCANGQAVKIASSHALVEASLRLEHLAASFISDASYFFAACQEQHTWPRLESLTLTSHLLHSDSNLPASSDHLSTSALIALRMPRLTSMELWNHSISLRTGTLRTGFLGVFQYHLSESDRTATITWRGSWELRLQPRVVKAWQDVASQRVDCNLQVVTETLDPDLADRSLDKAIRSLRLLNTVTHPTQVGFKE